MSASTVSITANPTTRRRPVLASEKKSNIELIAAELPQPKSADDKTATANGRDLSNHSIRGEAFLERSSREAVQLKKSAPNSAVTPPTVRRSRKPVPTRPRWLTVLSVFTKNLFLLLVLVGLVQMVRKVALRSGDGGSSVAFTDFEGRIAGMEALVKTTAKMIQVQVEVVDRKIESEVGALRKEVTKKIDDKDAVLERQLKELEARSHRLERTVEELRTGNWLSKEEFDKIYEDLKEARNGGYGDKEVTLDDIKAYAREVVRMEIEKHAADGLGMVDYALASAGGMVVKHSEPHLGGEGSYWFLRSARKGVHNDADKMLKPSFGEPGQCFPLKGSSGFVLIRLRAAIIPEAVTLEHVAKSVAYDRSSAPKNCRVSGWLQGKGTDFPDDTANMFLLTEFTYDLEKSNAQTFQVLDSAGTGVVDTVR
ncbi:SUN domain-containing protein 1-like isoform X2 [Ziziphus jujuba]|nr:SUN domain-containing protein 1-like isoform X2 [Ziziphus jujuba]